MSNPWFRMYAEFAHDPKVQMLPEVMQRRYVMLMCLRCSETAGATDEEVAFQLRLSLEIVAETKALFVARGFIDSDWNLLNWEKRQFASDSSAARVRAYRDKRKGMGLSSNGYTKHSETVMRRDGHACVYCSATKNLCIDHALPVCQGGDDSVENLVTACKACNSGKAGRTPEQAGYDWSNKSTQSIHLQWRNGYRNRTDTDTDTEKSSCASAVADAPASDRVPFQQIVDAYNATLTGLAKVRELTTKRKTLIRSAWAASPQRRSVPFWEAYFAECQDDDFLNGTGPYREPHANWRPTFDYLLRADVVTKVFERAMDRMERGQ